MVKYDFFPLLLHENLETLVNDKKENYTATAKII